MGQRKQRSDKKKEVKPYINPDLREMLKRMGFITSTPVKDICEFLVIHMISNKNTIDKLSYYFKRDIRIDNIVYRSIPISPAVNKRGDGTNQRIAVRFKQVDFDMISIFAYALDCSICRAVSFILEMALRDTDVANIYVKTYLNEQLDPDQLRDLRRLLKHMNSYNEDDSSWLSLMLVVMDEVTTPIKRIKEAVGEFLVNIRRYDE